jgi:hypothetical protein
MKRSEVIIGVPYYRNHLEPEEVYSLKHLLHFLGPFPKCLIVPEGLRPSLTGFSIESFPRHYFQNTSAYSRLLLSREFYERFLDYKHLLIYQLDCLVFRDELRAWCEQDYDYIGAPLFKVKDDPKSGFSGACNGGLSLRRVSAFLKVLNSRRYEDGEASLLADVFHQPFVQVKPEFGLKPLKKRLQVAREVRRGAAKCAAEYSLNEDHFWAGRATYFSPTFRLAPPDLALRFAFETAPSWCFERNGRELPFGAHAWQKYDRTFWAPHLLA